MKQETWSNQKTEKFREDLLAWYHSEKRDLPWRKNTDPYRVWVSEIMLQQTQVVTVIPYFNHFLSEFPTIKGLANAPEDKLLKAWEGLGYYSRVKNMQAAAQDIMERFDGHMPNNPQDILSLKGIGPYTGGAISSIAFNLAEPAVDGNVMRVYSRLFGIDDDIMLPKTRRVFEEKVRKTISRDEPGDFNQALMDLGARICTPKKPSCKTCPVKEYCLALKTNQVDQLPVKKKKEKPVPLYYVAIVLQNELGAYLLTKRPSDGLLANMWTFPLVEVDELTYKQLKHQEKFADHQELSLFDQVADESEVYLFSAMLTDYPNIKMKEYHHGEVTHVFSHRKWHILALEGRVDGLSSYQLKPREEWVYPEKFKDYPFPKPQQKLLSLLKKVENN
ncbi:A/G-specific adenine glycosylase [Vagococcus jeotgali]|uniref:A/G-specific adenine glycosylase n=1 Tax=Vagococcus jeotgali TaxID=3109030 RepID=UPI002DD92372|nr:A/G-specific adenine glycosylase [Vagococcus sp. B2T-5]